jgi:Activator of Hsp90 ATPase homolog 1-like protein
VDRVGAPARTRAPLIFQAAVRAAPEVVFDAFFRDPTRWLCRSASIEARQDGGLQLCWPEFCFAGRFVQFEAPTNARFSWRMQGDDLPETMVVVRIEAAESGSALELEHYGFGAGPNWDELYVSAARAWAGYLKNLRAVLEFGQDLREADE